MLEYKGYSGRAEFDQEAGLLHGEVLGLRDVVTFEGRSVEEIEQAFRDSVDDYLEFCEERGEEPDKPFSGRLVLRMDPEVHRGAYVRARREGKSLNRWIVEGLEARVGRDGPGAERAGTGEEVLSEEVPIVEEKVVGVQEVPIVEEEEVVIGKRSVVGRPHKDALDNA